MIHIIHIYIYMYVYIYIGYDIYVYVSQRPQKDTKIDAQGLQMDTQMVTLAPPESLLDPLGGWSLKKTKKLLQMKAPRDSQNDPRFTKTSQKTKKTCSKNDLWKRYLKHTKIDPSGPAKVPFSHERGFIFHDFQGCPKLSLKVLKKHPKKDPDARKLCFLTTLNITKKKLLKREWKWIPRTTIIMLFPPKPLFTEGSALKNLTSTAQESFPSS